MKKFTAFLLVIFLLAALSVPVSAAEAGRFLHPYYGVSEDTLYFLGTELPTGGTMSVSMGAQEDVDAELTTVAQLGMRTTVYCLVDTSETLNAKQVEQQKRILHAISGRMGTDDIMVIATIGESFAESEPLTTTADRKAAIDNIGRSGKVTNLNKGVVESINSLTTSNDYTLHRCLVILSDGINDGTDGTTQQAAVSAIAGSAVPVYSVAVLPPSPGQWAQNQAKPMHAYAEASLGGLDFTPAVSGIGEEDTAAAIWQSMQNSTVIMVDANDLDRSTGQDTLLLLARYDAQGVRYEDTVSVYAVDLPAAPAPVEVIEPTVEETEPEEEVEKEEEEEKKFPVLLVAAGGCAVVVIGLVVLIIVLATRKKPQPVPADPAPAPVPPAPIDILPIGVTEPYPENTAPVSQPQPEPALQDGCKVSLTVIGRGDLSYSFFLPVNVRKSVGRNSAKADFLLNQEDTQLSGRHCILEWNGMKLSVCDVSTYNSTCINGVRIQPNIWMNLENNATLRMGACDYRVKLERAIQ